MKKVVLLSLAMAAGGAYATQQQQSANDTIFLKPGQQVFSIKLKSNPTTGYSWFLGRTCHSIQALSAKYTAYQGKLVGAPGTVEWKFRVRKEAMTVPRVMKVKLLYMRPWDHSSATKKVYWVVVGRS